MNQNHTRVRNLNRRLFFLLGLLIAVALFLRSQQPNIFPSSLTNYIHSLAPSFDKLNPQGLTNKLSTALDSICLWSKGVYESSIEQSRWLINRWSMLAVIWGLLVPTVVLVLLFIISGIRHYFEKNMITNKFLSEVFKSIKSKISKAYRRNILIRWEQASLIILTLGIGLFFLQLLSANLWRWDRGIGWSSLFLFILYAYWVYYDHFLRQRSTKERLLGQIDSHLGLKQGLVTLMETKNFNASPRFYKLLLNEVFYKIKPAKLTKILPHKSLRFTKRNLVLPLLLIISLSGLVSVAHSRLVSLNFFSRVRAEVEYLFPLNKEPRDIEKLLKQEAKSLRLLTTELQHNQSDWPDIAYITNELNELATDLTHLAGGGLDIVQNDQYGDSQAMETSLSNKPSADHQAVNRYENQLNAPKSKRGKNTPELMEGMPASIPQAWPGASPLEEGTIDIPLRSSDKYYQAISAELKKAAKALLALKLDEDNTREGEADQPLILERGIPGMFSSPDYLANDSAGAEAESHQSEIKSRELWDNKADTDRGQSGQREPENLLPGEPSPSQASAPQSIANALDQIGNQLSNIKFYEAGIGEDDEPQREAHPSIQSSTQREVVNNIQLKPIKSAAKPEDKQEKATNGLVVLEHPHHLEIDPHTDQHPSAEDGRDQRFPLPDHPPANLKQIIKVNARRIEALGNRLLRVNQPEHISFNPQKGEAISSIWKKVTASIKEPRNIDNRLSQVTDRIRGVEDPRQIAAITSELAELTREFSAWGMDSGNKLSWLRPDLAQLTQTDSLGRRVDRPLIKGGPDKADRQAIIIRGKREQASRDNGDLERIRVEEYPRHLPQHDITTNVSLELNQVANRLENVDVASIKANMIGVNLRDFVVERERTLEILNDQLARAKDFQQINQTTHELADLSAQLGKLAIDSLATAELLANQQVIPENQKVKRDTANGELIDRINRQGRELLELSQQIKQERDPKSRADTSSQILMLAKGLREVDFDQIILNDYNKLQLKNLLRNLSKQLRKIDRNTTDLADLNGNSYAVAAVASRVDKLGVGEIDFTASAEGNDGGDMLDLAQLARQLSNLSQQMQVTAQASAPYQVNMPQPERNKELMEGIVDGAERLRQISERLELAGNQQDRERLGLELLKLSQMLTGRAAEDNTDTVKAVSTKSIVSIGNQLKQVGQQLRSNPDDYQPISERLQQIAGKLNERNQELTAAQLASNQDIAQLASDLSHLAQKLVEVGPDTLRQQEGLIEQTSNQISPDEHQQLISQVAQDLLNISQDLAELSIEETVPEYTNRLRKIIDELKGSDSPKQLDSLRLESLGQELAQLSQGLTQAGLDLGEIAATDGLPRIASELAELSQGLTLATNPLDTRQLTSQLTEIYDELNRLDLTGYSLEQVPTQELGSRLKQIGRGIRDLPATRLGEIASTLDRFGEDLLTANIPENRIAPHHHRLDAKQKGTSSEAITADSRRKREMALKNIDQVIGRLKLLYRKTEGRYNPELSIKGLDLATKGIAKANRGIMGKLKDSPYTKANFTADKVAKQIDVTPKKEMVSNAHSMEHNLTDRDVFKRIIKRLEDKRERISGFGALKQSETTTSRRAGTFSQPHNLDYEGRMLTMATAGLNPTTEGQGKRTAFLEEPKSYHDIEDLSPYTQEFLAPAIDEAEFSDLPLEKRKSKLKIPQKLDLHAKQSLDKALQDQPIPMRYRKIIKKLYLY